LPPQVAAKVAGDKPPLYVPSKRNPSENKKSTSYVAKTGFSALTSEAPFEENSKGVGAGFGSGGYIPSAMTA
jgi:hypothetical protein